MTVKKVAILFAPAVVLASCVASISHSSLLDQRTFELKGVINSGTIFTNDYDPAESSPLGRLGASVFGAGDDHVQTVYHYEPAITLDTIVTEVGRQHASQLTATIPEPAFRDAQSPSRSRDKVVHRDEHADVATQSVTRVNAFGQPEWSEQLEINAAIHAGSEPMKTPRGCSGRLTKRRAPRTSSADGRRT